MEGISRIIDEVILEIARQRSLDVTGITPGHSIVADLGFSSLDIAQLVATLELRLGIDPFLKDVSIASIKTVEDLYAAYAGAPLAA